MLDRVLRNQHADRLRRSVREKLVRAVAQAVAPYHEEQVRRLEALSKELSSLREEVHSRFDGIADVTAKFEHRARRDLVFAGEREAAADSARFVLDHMPTVPTFPDPHATLRHALSLVTTPGMALEFGVYTGTTLNIIASALPERDIYGFDSFAGLPEAWRSGYSAGTFSVDELPDVPSAELVVGWFDQTLPGFLAEHDDPIAFLHVDCDLHSSTKTVLDLVGPRLRKDSIVLFDEYFNYHGWREHEHKAWMEYVEKTGTEFRYEGYTHNHEQVIVRVTKVDEKSIGR